MPDQLDKKIDRLIDRSLALAEQFTSAIGGPPSPDSSRGAMEMEIFRQLLAVVIDEERTSQDD